MATRYYLLRDAASEVMPNAKQSVDSINRDVASSYATYANPSLMKVALGAQDTENSSTAAEPGSAHYTHYGSWISPPLAAQTVSGTVTVALVMAEGNNLANANPRVKIYKWLAGDSFGSDLLALITSGTECPAAFPASPVTYFSAQAIVSTDFVEGDRIVIEIETYDNNTKTSSYLHGIRFGGSGTGYGSYVEFSADIQGKVTTPSPVTKSFGLKIGSTPSAITKAFALRIRSTASAFTRPFALRILSAASTFTRPFGLKIQKTQAGYTRPWAFTILLGATYSITRDFALRIKSTPSALTRAFSLKIQSIPSAFTRGFGLKIHSAVAGYTRPFALRILLTATVFTRPFGLRIRSTPGSYTRQFGLRIRRTVSAVTKGFSLRIHSTSSALTRQFAFSIASASMTHLIQRPFGFSVAPLLIAEYPRPPRKPGINISFVRPKVKRPKI